MKNFKHFLVIAFLSIFMYGKLNAAVTITFAATQPTYLLNPPYISGVINDPKDPAATIGIRLDIQENGNDILATDYAIAATSSKTSVVAVSNVLIEKFNGYCMVKIVPTGVGYSNIKLTLTKAANTANITINYAASASSSTPLSTSFLTGISDASAAISLDTNYMLIGDDENNNLYVYDRKKSGLPILTYDYQNLLGLTDGSAGNYKEIDLEGSVKSPNIANRIYWISSLGTAGSSNSVKANINRLFATDVTGTGAAATINAVGYYNNIRSKLISWGDAKGYDFTTSAAAGHDSKTIDGFNVEGLCFAPNNTDLWIAFRAPLVPISNRTKAVIAPISNFENWFNNGTPTGNPTIGNAIELDLGGRGVRDIIRLSNGTYIIVAGNYDNTPLTGAIFKWTGNAIDIPILIPDFNIVNLNAEAVVEVNENGVLAENKLQVISDNGSAEFYNDGTEAKDLSQNNYKKFRSDWFTAATNVLPNSEVMLFEGRRNANNICLSWKTNDVNIDKIEVEKSLANNNFRSIAVIEKIEEQMKFVDIDMANPIVYYRLKIIHNNGKIEFSKVVIVNSEKQTQALVLYPNPSSNNSFWAAVSKSDAIVELFVYDINGKMVQTEKCNSNSVEIFKKNSQISNWVIKVLTSKGHTYEQVLLCK